MRAKGLLVWVLLACVLGNLTVLAADHVHDVTLDNTDMPTGPQECVEHTLPYLQNVTTDSIVVMWQTCLPANGTVRYRELGSLAWTELATRAPDVVHEVTISGLEPETTYEYQVRRDDVEDWAPATPATFQAAPDKNAAYRVVVYGDTRTVIEKHTLVAQAIASADPDIVIHIGDLVEYGRDREEWTPQFFGPAADLMLDTPMYPELGNHEYAGSGPMWYYDLFALPGNETYYAFTYGCARFVGLDTDTDFTPGSQQLTWLQNELQSTAYLQAAWKFAFFHYPPFTSGPNPATQRPTVEHLVPLFEKYGTDMVLAGHNHHYERSYKDGVHYIVTGGGGAPLHEFNRVDLNPYSQVRIKDYQYTTLDFDCSAGTVELNAWDVTGARIDGPIRLVNGQYRVFLPLVGRGN